MDIEQQAQEGPERPIEEAAPVAKTRRAPRRAKAAAGSPSESAGGESPEQVEARQGAADDAAGSAQVVDAPAAEAPQKPKRAPRSRKKAVQAAPETPSETVEPEMAAPVTAASAEAQAEVPVEAPAAPKSRSRRASARAAAAHADSKSEAATPMLPLPNDGEQGEEPTSASGSRAKSSVRARRRAVVAAQAAQTAVEELDASDESREAQVEPAPDEQSSRETKRPARRRAKAPSPEPAGEQVAEVAEGQATASETTEEPETQVEGHEEPVAMGPLAALFSEPLSPTSMIFQAPDLSVVTRSAPSVPIDDQAEEDEDDESGGSRRRRRSRGRRGRGRLDEGSEEIAEESEGAEGAEDSGEQEEVTSRRRRRRRRGESDLELEGGYDDDPPNTVTRVRAPRTRAEVTSNRVQSVKGSTRLEAKKQRRRESRESGRRRHVITEAEFLARRESVDRQMVVRQKEDRIQIAVLEDGVLAEHFVSKTQQDSLIGNVYLGKVQNVLPSMEAAFVDIGRGRNAVLYAGEVNWDAAGLEGAPRRIENALKSGDSVLVQVTKDPVGHKGARLTSQISLPGRYLVYVPGGSMTGISRKLPDVERNRLKRILKDRLPADAGVIVRTAAEGASEEELTHDINRLRAQWEAIQGQATSTKVLAPELLYAEPDLTIKVVRDVFNEDFSKLIVSGEEAWDTIEAYVTYVAPDLLGRLEKYQGDADVFAEWRIDEQIHKALDRKVFLPSGGSLVIDRTEAMTVIDVNTGKFTGSGGNLEETVTKNNLEAAEEIVRQLRLRDIGGIIVIDFIDMVLESNRDLVLRRLVECLGRDRTKHQVAEVTSLGLVQMTRKRMGTGLLEVFSETCEVCGGRGVITHEEPVERGRAQGSTSEHQPLRGDGQQATVRPERRRRRGRGPQDQEPAPAPVHHQPVPVPVPEADDAERQARAQATRAALAAVAAAAHAAHVHDDEKAHPEVHEEAPKPAPHHEPVPTPAANTSAAVPVLTIGGERIELPIGEAVPVAPRPEPKLSLDALSHAFDELTGERHSGEERPGRRRRSRGAKSGQGSAEVTRVDESAGAVGGRASTSSAQSTPAPEKPEGDGPLILGVGVPASEL
ncbi:Rne/Rng family ribonuclease [Sinomonas terrae]|uniref:Rne/Rng family ribonuclease n=1 Tax=Sinomonas terrae TaxID=2908838 RepID=A0ABS9U000_9MICC|nr:Rne/Rng family ribonuclease [Sinomonas terrae]MCH6470008.1 Rne/Rng family ribonuclease [Sinomonas terrae]